MNCKFCKNTENLIKNELDEYICNTCYLKTLFCSYCGKTENLITCNHDYCDKFICEQCTKLVTCKLCKRSDCKYHNTNYLYLLKIKLPKEILLKINKFNNEICYYCEFYTQLHS